MRFTGYGPNNIATILPFNLFDPDWPPARMGGERVLGADAGIDGPAADAAGVNGLTADAAGVDTPAVPAQPKYSPGEVAVPED